jgi:hypothetical protein
VGVYDEYIPRPALKCPKCRALLDERAYQGKDGPCRFLLWTQGEVGPTAEVDYERFGWKVPSEERARLRLPPRFGICSSCARCGMGFAVLCICDGEVWTICVIGDFTRDPEGKNWFAADAEPIPAHAVDARWRQCTRCTDAWEEEPEVRLSQCPGCRALTALMARLTTDDPHQTPP